MRIVNLASYALLRELEKSDFGDGRRPKEDGGIRSRVPGLARSGIPVIFSLRRFGHICRYGALTTILRMCGRYTLTTDEAQITAEFELVEPIRIRPRFNIAPSQRVPVVRVDDTDGARRLDELQWGLVPSWSKEPKTAYSTINARAETVATQPAFRASFRKRRCIVPASGFYEWTKTTEAGKEVKQPYYMRRPDDRLIGFAGLWERWTGPDNEALETFTIVTTTANELMRPLHHRMPVILRRDDYGAWLNPDAKPDGLQALLVPCPDDWLVCKPVSRRVNSPRNDDPTCVVPLS